MATSREVRSLVKLSLPDRVLDITDSLGRIDYDNLRGESERIGADVVWYGVLSAASRRRASQAALAAKIKEATLYRKYRNQAKQMGEKWTENDLKERVHLDPDYAVAFETMFEKEEQASILESTKFALVQKQKDLNALTNTQVAQAERLLGDGPPSGRVSRTPMKLYP